MPIGSVLSFQRTFYIPSAFERNKFLPLVFSLVLCKEQFLPHLTALHLQTN